MGELDSLSAECIPLELVRYLHDVKVQSIYDGDTPTLFIELGFSTARIEDFRLSGINTPEIRFLSTRAEGEKSRNHLIELIRQYDYLFVQTFPERDEELCR